MAVISLFFLLTFVLVEVVEQVQHLLLDVVFLDEVQDFLLDARDIGDVDDGGPLVEVLVKQRHYEHFKVRVNVFA